MDAAGRAVEELGAVLQVVKKSSREYALEDDPPPCPSVMVGGELFVENGTVTFEALKAALNGIGAGGQEES